MKIIYDFIIMLSLNMHDIGNHKNLISEKKKIKYKKIITKIIEYSQKALNLIKCKFDKDYIFDWILRNLSIFIKKILININSR